MNLPNPHKNWWCYTNCCVPAFNNHSRINQNVLQKCKKDNSHLVNTGNHYDFNQPLVFTCFQPKDDSPSVYGEKQCFVDVYGLRKMVYLQFTMDMPSKWANVAYRQEILTYLQDMNLHSIRDMKLVYKRPYKKACLGSKLVLKLYINGHSNVNTFRERIMSLNREEMSCIDKKSYMELV